MNILKNIKRISPSKGLSIGISGFYEIHKQISPQIFYNGHGRKFAKNVKKEKGPKGNIFERRVSSISRLRINN